MVIFALKSKRIVFCSVSDKKCVTDFEQFFKDNYQRMYFLAYGLLHDGELSKDVVSSAFEELVARFDELDATRRAGYLYSVVRNKCAAYYRKQAAHDNYAQHYLAHAERSQSIDFLEHAWKPFSTLSTNCPPATAKYSWLVSIPANTMRR